MELQPGAMDTLGKVSNGDLRKAITTLQSAVRLKASILALCVHHPQYIAPQPQPVWHK